MNHPEPGDFIDIHNHGSIPDAGLFQVENLMTHENRIPDNEKGLAYTIGIHPWFLTAENYGLQIELVRHYSKHTNIIALGETGFDRLKGPAGIVQQTSFREHVRIADKVSKPVFIHCVRAWDELLSESKILRPATPWVVHGFRGKKELALQLISRGMYISFWFDFVIRPESRALLKSLPIEKIFLEKDGSDIRIEDIYQKVSSDLETGIGELKQIISNNYNKLFK